MGELRTETMTVNMGPQHPSTHGVLRLVLELDGETVRSMAPTIGYLHTGIEKTTEQKRWQQVIPLVADDRPHGHLRIEIENEAAAHADQTLWLVRPQASRFEIAAAHGAVAVWPLVVGMHR